MNRSEELCKLLGLKTEIRWRGALGLHLWEHKIIDDNGNETEKVEVYPDLTKPSNFVKLLNLVYKCGINSRKDFNLASMSCEEDNCTLAGIEFDTFEDEWLEYIAHMMSRTYDSWDRKFIEITKHQAQATKWDY